MNKRPHCKYNIIQLDLIKIVTFTKFVRSLNYCLETENVRFVCKNDLLLHVRLNQVSEHPDVRVTAAETESENVWLTSELVCPGGGTPRQVEGGSRSFGSLCGISFVLAFVAPGCDTSQKRPGTYTTKRSTTRACVTPLNCCTLAHNDVV